MFSAQCEHRKTMGPAMSSGVATRPTGIVLRIASRSALLEKTSFVMSVSTQPGATQFTLMPDGASSLESDFVNAICPPFDAA
jgi:hypothetical protein